MTKRNYAKRETKEYTFWMEICQWIAVWFATMPYVFLFYKVKVYGRENIPQNKSFIIAPTHSGYLDPILSSYATQRPIAYMAKQELFDIWWLRPLIVMLGTFSVNRNKLEIATIRTAQAILKTNHWLLSMFPQGTRDIPKEITKITPGFAYLARAAKADILPMSITGTNILSKKLFSQQIVVRIGKPFSPSKDLSETMTNWCNAIEEMGDFTITDEAKDKIQKIKEKKDNNENANSKG